MSAEPWPDDEPAVTEPPHDLRAERKVLSAILDGALVPPSLALDAIEICAEQVGLLPEHFYRPAHQVLYDALVTMATGGERITVETARDWVIANADVKALGGPAHAGMLLLELAGLHEPAVLVGPLARIVLARAGSRRWLEASDRIRQYATRSVDVDDLSGRCSAEADAAAAQAGGVVPRAMRLHGAAQFMMAAGAKPAPVIPGVLNRMDRVVVVGRGGSGKTILALQHGLAAAVGIHPFGKDRFDPARVLWIDLELPDYLAAEDLELVMSTARYYGDPDEGGRFQVLHRPRGINLGDPGQAQLMAGLIRKAKPDLVIAGPVYKMHADRGERSDHTSVMDFWDDMRDRHGFALWLETHPAKPGGRFGGGDAKHPTPAGSSRWGDWCEIGFGLVPGNGEHQWDVVPFRGQRDRTRPWPEQFTVNVAAGWPWLATYPQGTFGGM